MSLHRLLAEYTTNSGVCIPAGTIVAISEPDPSGWWFANWGSGSDWLPSSYLAPEDAPVLPVTEEPALYRSTGVVLGAPLDEDEEELPPPPPPVLVPEPTGPRIAMPEGDEPPAVELAPLYAAIYRKMNVSGVTEDGVSDDDSESDASDGPHEEASHGVTNLDGVASANGHVADESFDSAPLSAQESPDHAHALAAARGLGESDRLPQEAEEAQHDDPREGQGYHHLQQQLQQQPANEMSVSHQPSSIPPPTLAPATASTLVPGPAKISHGIIHPTAPPPPPPTAAASAQAKAAPSSTPRHAAPPPPPPGAARPSADGGLLAGAQGLSTRSVPAPSPGLQRGSSGGLNAGGGSLRRPAPPPPPGAASAPMRAVPGRQRRSTSAGSMIVGGAAGASVALAPMVRTQTFSTVGDLKVTTSIDHRVGGELRADLQSVRDALEGWVGPDGGRSQLRLLHHGELMKISKGKAQRRHFFLFDAVLVYCKRDKRKLEIRGTLPMAELLIKGACVCVCVCVGLLGWGGEG
jgi:hypothetical protein